MATTYKTVEVWVLIDEDGDYEVGASAEEAATRYADTVAQPDGERGMRRVKLAVRVPLPTPIELSGEVACEEAGAGLTAAG